MPPAGGGLQPLSARPCVTSWPPVTALPVPNHYFYHFVSVRIHHLHRSIHIYLPHTRALRLTARSRSSSSTCTCPPLTPGPGKRWFPAGRISASLHSFYSVTTRMVQLEIFLVSRTPCAAFLPVAAEHPLYRWPRPPVPPSAAAPPVPHHPAAL